MASIVLSSKEQLLTWIIGVYSQIKLKYQLKVKKEKDAVILLMRKYQTIQKVTDKKIALLQTELSVKH